MNKALKLDPGFANLESQLASVVFTGDSGAWIEVPVVVTVEKWSSSVNSQKQFNLTVWNIR